MGNFVAIILGVVEGATEFIPVSSSGHLIIARQLLGANTAGGLSFDAVLQLATSLALAAYFWKDIIRLIRTFFAWIFRGTIEYKERTLLLAIIIGTIPAVIFGLLLEKEMDTIFRNVFLVALTLILGSLLFWVAQKLGKKNKILSVGRGIVIGFFQCLALVPGVSRSGATISGGLLAGLSQEEAVRFSFLLSVPVLFGSGLKKLFEVRHELASPGFATPLLLGSIAAFIVGFFSIKFLIDYLKKHNLNFFIWYRVFVAVLIFVLFK